MLTQPTPTVLPLVAGDTTTNTQQVRLGDRWWHSASPEGAAACVDLLTLALRQGNLLHELGARAAVTWDMRDDEATPLHLAWAEHARSLAEDTCRILGVQVEEPPTAQALAVPDALVLSPEELAILAEHSAAILASRTAGEVAAPCGCLVCRTARILGVA